MTVGIRYSIPVVRWYSRHSDPRYHLVISPILRLFIVVRYLLLFWWCCVVYCWHSCSTWYILFWYGICWCSVVVLPRYHDRCSIFIPDLIHLTGGGDADTRYRFLPLLHSWPHSDLWYILPLFDCCCSFVPIHSVFDLFGVRYYITYSGDTFTVRCWSPFRCLFDVRWCSVVVPPFHHSFWFDPFDRCCSCFPLTMEKKKISSLFCSGVHSDAWFYTTFRYRYVVRWFSHSVVTFFTWHIPHSFWSFVVHVHSFIPFYVVVRYVVVDTVVRYPLMPFQILCSVDYRWLRYTIFVLFIFIPTMPSDLLTYHSYWSIPTVTTLLTGDASVLGTFVDYHVTYHYDTWVPCIHSRWVRWPHSCSFTCSFIPVPTRTFEILHSTVVYITNTIYLEFYSYIPHCDILFCSLRCFDTWYIVYSHSHSSDICCSDTFIPTFVDTIPFLLSDLTIRYIYSPSIWWSTDTDSFISPTMLVGIWYLLRYIPLIPFDTFVVLFPVPFLITHSILPFYHINSDSNCWYIPHISFYP